MVQILIVKVVTIAAAISFITIGVAIGIIYATVPLVDNVYSCRKLQLPDFLVIVHIDGVIVSSWAPPANSENCDVSYKLQYDDHKGSSYSVETSQNSHIFRTNPMPCTVITITISLAVDSEPTGNSITNNYKMALGIAQDLSIDEQNDGTLELTWGKPVNSDECGDITYKIEYEGKDEETSELTYSIPIADLTPCIDIEIIVTPLSHPIVGIADSVTHVKKLGTVDNLAKHEVGGVLELTWEKPLNIEECGDISYKIEYENQSKETSGLSHSITVAELTQCKLIEILVTPFGDTFSGLTDRLIYENALTTVDNLRKEEVGEALEISWEKPVNSDECRDITYKIEYEGKSKETRGLSYLIPFIELSQCNDVKIIVTPFSDIFTGIASSLIYENTLGTVDILRKEEVEETLEISWEKPVNSDQCDDITYRIEYEDNKDETPGLSYTIPLTALSQCNDVEILVTPFTDTLTGIASLLIYETGLRTVDNLRYEEVGEALEMSWGKPVNSDECDDITYRIQYEENENEMTGLSYTIPFTELSQCNDVKIIVTPFSDTLIGIASSLIYKKALRTVDNLRKEEVGEALEISWGKPVNSDQCDDITYRIEYEGNSYETLSLSHPIPFIKFSQCNDVDILVTPFTDTLIGIASLLIYENGLRTVANLQKVEVEETFEVSWEEPVNSDKCGVIKYRIAYEEITRETLDLNYAIPFTELRQCNDIEIFVTPVAGTLVGIASSLFYENGLRTVDNLQKVEVEDTLEISWEQPVNSDECGVITYRVESEGITRETFDLNYAIPFTELSQCNDVEILVTPFTGTFVGIASSMFYENGLRTVDNLRKQEVGEVLEISWGKPVNSDQCDDITYRIEYEGNSYETPGLSYTIPFTELSQCKDVEIIVTPFTDTLIGIGSLLIYENGLRTVANLQKVEVEETFEVSWEEPVNSDKCGVIKYRIEYEEITRETLDLNYAIPFTELRQCNDIEITVTPVAGTLVGIASSLFYENGLRTVDNLQKVEVEDTLEISWEQPVNSDECGVITYRVESEGITRETFDLNYAIPFTELSQCNDVEILVTPFTGTFVGIASSMFYENGLRTVDNLRKQEVGEVLEISWGKPVNSDQCDDITYRIEYEGKSYETPGLSYTIPFTELSQCKDVEIIVTPFTDTLIGIGSLLIYENGLRTVANLQKVEVEETFEVSWEEPVNSDKCGVIKYRIEYEEITRETLDLNYAIPFTELRQCNDIEITVTPVAGTLVGIASSLFYENGLRTVDNLQKVEVEDTLEISWEQPVNSDECGVITYRVESEGITRETFDLNYAIPFTELSQCNDIEIFVTPFTGTFVGIASSLFYENGLRTVDNLRKEEVGEALEISWGRPVNSDECDDITYRIEYEGNEDETPGLSYTIPFTELSQCKDVEIVVTPFTGTFMGTASSIFYENGLGTVDNLRKELEEDVALEISWARPINSDECGDIKYRISYGDYFELIAYPTHRIPISRLTECIEIFVIPLSVTFIGITDSLIYGNDDCEPVN